MEIIRADALGMCFGVRDALAIAQRLGRPQHITILGQLVHNPLVQARLAGLGFKHISGRSTSEPPSTDDILITAHGISNTQRRALLTQGKRLIDTTCPLVKKAHAAALQLAADGYHVLVLGQRDHVEILGLTGDLASFDIIETLVDVRSFPHSHLGIIAQTTTPTSVATQLITAIRAQNPRAKIRHIDTICQPTKDRQTALESLLQQITVLVVVGGKHSNNTLQLVRRAQAKCMPTFHIEQPAELLPHWFSPTDRIGLTAGTSTLPETIAATHDMLLHIAQQQHAQSFASHAV